MIGQNAWCLENKSSREYRPTRIGMWSFLFLNVMILKINMFYLILMFFPVCQMILYVERLFTQRPL